jgi:WhiB family transcriptional regulator, redox-sensing transcriptional regulator
MLPPGITVVPAQLGTAAKDGKAREKLHKLQIDAQTRALPPVPGRREGVDIMDWRHEAACREVDPELFFPIGNSGPALLQIEEAKQVCRRCSVMDECLRWAIESGQDAGVWGGMGEDERRALKRRTIRLRARAHV